MTLSEFIGVPLETVLGEGLANLATQVSARDERAVKAELDRLLKAARAKPVTQVASRGFTEATFVNGRVVRAVSCPACDNEAYVTGWPIRRSDTVVLDGDLVRRVSVASHSFECDHCGLKLPDRPLLVAAGLPDVFETTEAVDPYEALALDATEEIERMGMVVVDPDWEPDFDDIGD